MNLPAYKNIFSFCRRIFFNCLSDMTVDKTEHMFYTFYYHMLENFPEVFEEAGDIHGKNIGSVLCG